MKKYIMAIISLTLALVFFFSACNCNGCKDDNSPEEPTTVETERATYQGTHIYTMNETNEYLVQNGKSDYVVVVPQETTNYLRTAMSEFTYLFKMATNIDLKTTNDAGLTHSKDAKYISLGKTNLLATCGVDESEYSASKLSNDGGRIFTVDNTIYIVGGYDTGTLFAVYKFMSLTFNYESYYSSCIEIDKNVTNKKLMDYDVTDIPDFKTRLVGLGSGQSINFSEYDDVNFMYRMGYQSIYPEKVFRMHQVVDDPNSPSGFSVKVDGKYSIGTNTDKILNKDETSSAHPKWFSDVGVQWCYTAHGDGEEYEKMITAVTESVKYALTTYSKEEYPLKSMCSITQEDNDDFCSCSTCSAELAKYGTHAGAVIKFMNDVSDKVNAWLAEGDNQEKYGRENFVINFFAYGPTETPPVKRDEATGEWVAVDESVIPRENLMVMHANINADYQQGIYAEDNAWVKDKADGWAALTDKFSWYTYTTNRRGFMYFYDSFNHFTSEGFQYYASIDDSEMFIESQTNNPTPSAWNNLKFYMASKLQWDCTLDEKELMDDFFNAMYGPGAKYMRQFFDAERMYCYNEYKSKNMYKRWSIYNYVNRDCEWPITVLQSWIELCDKALEAVEPLKNSNPEAYENYCKHIEIEAIAPIVIMFDHHFYNMSQPTKDYYLGRLRNDIKRWDLSQMLVVHVAYGTPTMLPEWVEQQGGRV